MYICIYIYTHIYIFIYVSLHKLYTSTVFRKEVFTYLSIYIHLSISIYKCERTHITYLDSFSQRCAWYDWVIVRIDQQQRRRDVPQPLIAGSRCVIIVHRIVPEPKTDHSYEPTTLSM